MTDPRAGRHRWSWFADHASETKVVLWVGVATVLTGLLGAAATLVSEFSPLAGDAPPLANTPPAPPTTAASEPARTTNPEPSPSTASVVPAASSPTVALPPLTEIPADLLLHAADVARNPDVWRSHDKPVGFDLIQCQPFDLSEVPYTDIRVLQEVLPDRSYFETLILYGDEVAAARVFGTLRQAIQECPPSPWDAQPGITLHRTQRPYAGGQLPSGGYDESMLVSEAYLDGAGQPIARGRRMVITRRGTALVLYSTLTPTAPQPADFTPLVSDTARILPALCKFDNPRCR